MITVISSQKLSVPILMQHCIGTCFVRSVDDGLGQGMQVNHTLAQVFHSKVATPFLSSVPNHEWEVPEMIKMICLLSTKNLLFNGDKNGQKKDQQLWFHKYTIDIFT